MSLNYPGTFFMTLTHRLHSELPCLVFEQIISEQSCLVISELQQNDLVTPSFNQGNKLSNKIILCATVGTALLSK